MDTLAGALGTRVIANICGSYESYERAFSLLILICLFAIACIAFMRKPTVPDLSPQPTVE